MDSKDIKIIKAAFHQMKTKEDFLALLNLAKPFVYGDKAVPFELKQLTWYANPNSKSRRYTEFKIKKKSGAERSINAPVKGLKAIQKTISFILQCVFEPHKSAMGFAKDKSVVDNAKIHEGNNYVYNIDLKDFFSSIDQARFWKTLQLKPFNLFEERAIAEETLPLTGVDELPQIEKLGDLKYLLKPELKRGRLHLANMIASLCCAELEVERKDEHGQWKMVKRNVLPQGAPSSPVVTNIICQKLDHRLSGLAKRFGLKYSRYADDITFSSMHNVYQNDSDFITELNRIIADQNFHIKDSKTRLQKEGYRQEVTGLLVNDKANVQKRYVKQLRMWLYYWERYGLEKATNKFTQNYTANKTNLGSAKPNMANVIKGKLDYLKMVKGGKNKTYLKLRERYDHLIASIKKNKAINPTEVTNDDIIEFYGGIEEIKKLAEESKVFIDRVRNNNNANHEEAPPVNPQEREETEIPRWTIKEITEYIKKDPELSKHILRKNKKAKDYSQQKQQPKSEEPKVSEPHPFASIPGLITNPDEMDEIMEWFYGEEVTTNKNIINSKEEGHYEGEGNFEKPAISTNTNVSLSSSDKKATKYLDPYLLYIFLFEFNQNPVLRTTCHDADSDTIQTINEYCDLNSYCFSAHFKKIIESYNEHEIQYPAPYKVKAMIRGYLTGKDYEGNLLLKGWSSENIFTNWSSPELIDWSKKYSGVPPNINMALAEEKEIVQFTINPQINSIVSFDPIQNFTQLVLHFKNLFHIKSGKQSLWAIIDRTNVNKKWYEIIEFDVSETNFSSNIELFTDVDKLLQAYIKLVQLVLAQHTGKNKPVVRLSYFETSQKICFSIHHINGKYNKSLESTLRRPIGDQYDSLIKNQINGLCNLRLKADFGNNNFAEINLWDGEILIAKELQNFSGVEHVLEFAKTKKR